MKLKASTTTTTGRIGNNSQGCSCTAARFCASLSSTPQLVTGGRRPRPRNDSAVSPRIIEGIESVAEAIRWLMKFGIRWRAMMRRLDAPISSAARTKSSSRNANSFERTAELMGASKRRIIARHLIPNFMSHLIASATLSIPSMILGETALSFLGLGLRPPVTSWGVLLNEAQNLAAVQLHPWLLFPILPVVVVVLAFNFMGDGLRDAADPYH